VAGTVAGTGFSVQINSGATQATLDISGSVDATKSQAQVFSALTTAINNSADLKAAGVTAGLDSSSNLIIRNNNGADIAVMFTLTGATGGVYDLYGSDSAATALAAQATTVSGVVGGQLNVNMANGYSISSSVDGTAGLGLFKSAASASVNVKETNVGIADVMNGDTTANQVGTYGLDIGKAIAGTVNATLAQSVKVFDSSGKQVGGTISVAINASAQTITGQLNALTGVNATASTQATMNFANATTAVFAFSLNTTALTVSGITATSTGAQVANATAQAINGNTTLVGKGFSANVDGAGNLIINNSLGADIAVDMTGSTASAATLTGTDASGTMLAANVAQQGVVSGSLKIGLSSGYTIQSSIAGTLTTGGLFAGSANTNATVHTNGVNVGDSVAAQTLKIQGAIGNASVEVAKNDAADVIANKINAQAAATGVNASAYTQAKLSNISAAGSVSFTLFGTNTAGVTVSGAVTGFGSTADLSGLANAINTASTKTGISASLTDNKASIILTQADGKNINVVNFNHSAAVQPFAANINGTDQSIQVRGLTQTADAATGSLSATTTAATTLHAGGVANYGNDSTVIGGTLSFNSKDNFNVSSSASGDTAALSGGKSSLFSGAAQTANTSGLETVTGVDVSTVAGANSAISVIDAALTQVNSIRATLGAVQNRMQSTISSLSAGVENLSAARSRIQDTDFASETASLTRSQILQQAGVAMLSQANQLPQMVLSLLK
jgi:flagellin